MRCTYILLALVAFATAIPPPTIKQRAADQSTVNKQQDVIYLLQQVAGKIPNEQLQVLGTNYDIENNYHQYQNPNIVKYYVGSVKAGLVQPQGTPFSGSLSQLRKEVSLLSQILIGAKDYQTFLSTAAWAHVHVNEAQFVHAFVSAVLLRPDTQGVIVPAIYEIFPQHHLDSRIIQEAQDASVQGVQNVVIPVNYSAHLPHGEHQLSYFTQDIGLANYYNYVNLAGAILGQGQQTPVSQYQQPGVGQYKQQSVQEQQSNIGHGSQYYYVHQQLLAHYELNRLSNGLGPIPDVDYEKVESPYQPHFRHLNGLEFPGRPHVLEQPQHNQKLVQKVHTLLQRLIDAIDAGQVITPQGAFLSLYQPQGLNILGDLIEGTGKSVNPLYYGSLQAVARKLLGNAPEVQNIYDYTPSVLELSETAVHDPAFYQLYKQVIQLFQQYQAALPPHQYSDLVLPGVSIQNVDISQLATVFTDFFVNLDSVTGQQQPHHPESHHIKAHLKRLDHKPYEYHITVQSEQSVPGAVVRVYLGPKYDYEGKPISISQQRHLFVEIDQFVQNLQQGENVIIRHSQQAPGKSHDHPSIDEIQQHVEDAIRSQEPLYITELHQIFNFPARLSLPKGQPQGFPLQLLVVISAPGQQQVSYGPVVPEEQQTYQPQHFQVVGVDESHIQQQQQVPHLPGVQQSVEVLPENLVESQQGVQGSLLRHKRDIQQSYSVTHRIHHLFFAAVRSHYADLYTKHHGQYPYPQGHIQIGQGVQPLSIQGQQQHYGQQLIQQGQQHWQHQQQEHHGQQNQQQQQPNYQQLPQYQQVQQVQQGQQQLPQGQQYVGQQQYQYQPQQQVFHGQQPQQQQLQQQQLHQQQVQQQQQHQGPFQGQQHVNYQQQQFHVTQQQPIIKSGVQYGVHGVQQVGGQQVTPVHVVQGVYQTPQGPIVASGQQHYGGYQGIYAQGQIVQDQSVNEYYQGKHISEVIGGGISLDGKPLGFPLDRPLTPGALSVPNIFVKDVFVYHEGQPTSEVSQ